MSAEAKSSEIFFNVMNGELYIGKPAVEQAFAEHTDIRDIVPLIDVINDQTLLPSSNVVESIGRSNISKDEAIIYGKWLSGVIKVHEPSHHLTEDTIERAYNLGLGPYQKSLTGKFDGKLWRFQDAIGESNGYARGRFSGWGTSDFKEYAKRVEQAVHRKPKTADFQRWFEKGKGPSPAYIRRRIGGVDVLQELIGYPNIYEMTEGDYIDYGVKVMEANPDKKVTRTVFDELSKRKRGPSTRSIVNHFDRLSKFQAIIGEEFAQKRYAQETEEKHKVGVLTNLVEKGELPAKIHSEAEGDNRRLIQTAARYLVIQGVAMTLKPKELIELATQKSDGWVKQLGRLSKGRVTPGIIEREALILNVYDDIWPMDEHLRYLKVT